jgi:UDP-GlcNAc:undecaprenyl-phosphate GlcNAc-1-phosphate transferase
MTFVASAQAGHPFGMISAAALAGAAGGFLLYNFNPATIFMGDSGSMFLGYVLAATALQRAPQTGQVELVAFVVALGVPIADTLVAMLRRAIRGVPLFVADREHIHHRLLDLGLTPRQAALTVWALAVLLAGAGTTLAGAGPGALVVAVAISGAIGLNQLGCWGFQNPAALLARRRRNVERRRAIRATREQLRSARRVADLLGALETVGPALGARCIWLHLDAMGGTGERTPLRLGPLEDGAPAFRTMHGILGERPGGGSLEVAWRGERTSLDRDSEIAIELLCDDVAAALRQIGIELGTPRPAERLHDIRQAAERAAREATARESVDRAS